MQRPIRRVCCSLLFAISCCAQNALPPRALTWQETLDRFRLNNPQLLAGKMSIDESRAQEISATCGPTL